MNVSAILSVLSFVSVITAGQVGSARPNCKNGMPANQCSTWSTVCVKGVIYDQGGFAHPGRYLTRVCNSADCTATRQYKTSSLCTTGGAIVRPGSSHPQPINSELYEGGSGRFEEYFFQ